MQQYLAFAHHTLPSFMKPEQAIKVAALQRQEHFDSLQKYSEASIPVILDVAVGRSLPSTGSKVCSSTDSVESAQFTRVWEYSCSASFVQGSMNVEGETRGLSYERKQKTVKRVSTDSEKCNQHGAEL